MVARINSAVLCKTVFFPSVFLDQAQWAFLPRHKINMYCIIDGWIFH